MSADLGRRRLLPTASTYLHISVFLTLLLFGAGYGAMDVAMNAQGVAVEKRYRRPILSSFHGLFSAGGMVGAAIGGVIASLEVVGPLPHLTGVVAEVLTLRGGLGVVVLLCVAVAAFARAGTPASEGA